MYISEITHVLSMKVVSKPIYFSKTTFFVFSSPLARLLFPAKDDHTLKFLYDDNQRVEPEWYIPIIPMVLINGAEGIGTGWSCKIPNFDVREVVNNIRRLMDGEEPLPMVTILWTKNLSFPLVSIQQMV